MRSRTRALGAVAGVLALAPFGLTFAAAEPATASPATSPAAPVAAPLGDPKLDAKIADEAAGKKPEVSIPFVDAGGIRDWRAVGRDALLVEGTHGKWYRVELMSGCFDLPFAERVGFKSNPTGDFDRFSTVIVRGQRCPVKSVTASAPPPKPVKKDRHHSTSPAAVPSPAKEGA